MLESTRFAVKGRSPSYKYWFPSALASVRFSLGVHVVGVHFGLRLALC